MCSSVAIDDLTFLRGLCLGGGLPITGVVLIVKQHKVLKVCAPIDLHHADGKQEVLIKTYLLDIQKNVALCLWTMSCVDSCCIGLTDSWKPLLQS